MRKHLVILGLTFLALAGLSIFAGWTFFSSSQVSDGWRTLGPLWPYAVGAAALLAALVALLLWLAFYSANHRYEDDGDT
jgi:hypothetical protein